MIIPRVLRTLEAEETNPLWRVYKQSDGTFALVKGLEVEGELIAGPGERETVFHDASLEGKEVTSAIQRDDSAERKCAKGYHSCEDRNPWCCPDGEVCIGIPPYCF